LGLTTDKSSGDTAVSANGQTETNGARVSADASPVATAEAPASEGQPS